MKKNFFKKYLGIIKAYLCVFIYHIDRWIYRHLFEHKGMYLKVHKSYARDLQQELDIALVIRKNRKEEGEFQSIFYYSLDWEV